MVAGLILHDTVVIYIGHGSVSARTRADESYSPLSPRSGERALRGAVRRVAATPEPPHTRDERQRRKGDPRRCHQEGLGAL